MVNSNILNCIANPLQWKSLVQWRNFAATVFFNFLLFYGLNPLQLTQEKEKSSVDQGFTGCVNIFLLECTVYYKIIRVHIPSTDGNQSNSTSSTNGSLRKFVILKVTWFVKCAQQTCYHNKSVQLHRGNSQHVSTALNQLLLTICFSNLTTKLLVLEVCNLWCLVTFFILQQYKGM